MRRTRKFLSKHAVTIGLIITAALTWLRLGPGPFSVWLTLAAIAAPILGMAFNSDEAFDVAIDDIEPCSDYDEEYKR